MFKLKLKKTHDSKPKKPVLAVVLMHGIGTDSRNWHNALKFLEGTKSLENVRFITFDWLGFGKSSHRHSLEYNYEEQLAALENSLAKINTPVVLVGHSLGTLLVSRYAHEHKKAIERLVLLSPPVFSREEIRFLTSDPKNNLFYQKIDPKLLKSRIFMNTMNNIVFNIKNQKTFEDLTTPADLIYGDEDPLISIRNLKTLAKNNPKYLNLIKTTGHHSISRIKYTKLMEILERMVHEAL
ncbi:alpha/beta fold hydrolase [Candidatus Saccharibacteria bacterium]|nr:alpha/beta fold hydrolase [Candidatus Saccharibacteria bacterium]